jgi:hypothetical protein
VGIALTSLLGPLVLGVLDHRTSPTTLNQIIGSDLAGLVFVAPLCLVTAFLAHRENPAAPLMALGVGIYATYTFAQLVIGQEYLRLPGNVERFFPLLLAVFVLAEATVVLAWRYAPHELPPLSPALERTAGVALVAVAAFLVIGLHLPSMLTAWREPAALTEYASSPTPFWLVKLMDLGILVPAAVTTGIGVLRHAGWARRAMYLMLTAYTCLAVSVAAMGAVMVVAGDPDASAGLTAGFVGFALGFLGLTTALYRPLFARTAGARNATGRGSVPSSIGSRPHHS